MKQIKELETMASKNNQTIDEQIIKEYAKRLIIYDESHHEWPKTEQEHANDYKKWKQLFNMLNNNTSTNENNGNN